MCKFKTRVKRDVSVVKNKCQPSTNTWISVPRMHIQSQASLCACLHPQKTTGLHAQPVRDLSLNIKVVNDRERHLVSSCGLSIHVFPHKHTYHLQTYICIPIPMHKHTHTHLQEQNTQQNEMSPWYRCWNHLAENSKQLWLLWVKTQQESQQTENHETILSNGWGQEDPPWK